jgi:hypothetical protein
VGVHQRSILQKPIITSLSKVLNREEVRLMGFTSWALIWPFLPGLGIKTTLLVLQAYGTNLRATLALRTLVKEPSNIPSHSCSRMWGNFRENN